MERLDNYQVCYVSITITNTILTMFQKDNLFVLGILFMFVIHISSAQSVSDSSKSMTKNAIYFELGGNGIFYTINYDRLLRMTDKSVIFLRIGGSHLKFSSFNNVASVITELNRIFYKQGRSVNFEIGSGIGAIYYYPTDTDPPDERGIYLTLTGRIGLRIQSEKREPVIRLGLTPMIALSNNGHLGDFLFFPLAGLSVGYCF